MGTIDWAAFVPAAVGISLVPGANQILSLQNAYRRGAAVAAIAASGRFTAFAIMVVLVGLGLGAVLVRSSTVFTVVTWAGIAYLLFLGARSWYVAGWPRGDEPAPTGTAVSASSPGVAAPGTWALTRREFTVAVTNPKALLLFAAILPQFVDGSGSVATGLMLVGFAYIGIEAVSAAAYTLVGARLRRFTLTAARDRLLERVSGTCLIGFAAYLGLTARSTG